MAKYLMQRLAVIPLVLLVLTAAVFALRQISPVDPARALVGEQARPEVIERARNELGLNDPVLTQYVRYIAHVARGDLGMSTVTRRPVRTDLATFLPATLELVITAFAMACVLGMLLGLATSIKWRGSGPLRFVMITMASVPVFFTSLLLIILMFRILRWLPATGRSAILGTSEGPTHFILIDGILKGRFDVVIDGARHLVMPAVSMAIVPAAWIGRILRSSLQHSLRSEYVRTARAKGLSELRVLLQHSVRNASGPVLAIAGLQVATLFGAMIVVEKIFAWPGLGLYVSQAIDTADFTAIAGVTLTLGSLYVLASAAVDILQAAADPRIRI